MHDYYYYYEYMQQLMFCKILIFNNAIRYSNDFIKPQLKKITIKIIIRVKLPIASCFSKLRFNNKLQAIIKRKHNYTTIVFL